MGFYYLKGKQKKAEDFAGRWEKLDRSERWLEAGLSIAPAPGSFALIEIDVSAPLKRFSNLSPSSSASHLEWLMKAVGMALERHRHLYKMALGHRRYYPTSINISLSIAGDTFVAPVAVIEDVNRKSVSQLNQEILQKGVLARRMDERIRQALNRFGWLFPFQFLRRLLITFLMRIRGFKEKGSGAIQMTYVPHLDSVVALKFTASAIFAVGAMRERVVAVDGQPVVRPTVFLSCALDHSVWDGMCTALIMKEIKKIIEEEAEAL